MANYLNPMPVRLHTEKDAELIAYFEEHGGIKTGIRALFTHYKATKDIVEYLDHRLPTILQSLEITTTAPKKVEETSEVGKNGLAFLSKLNF